MPQQPLFEFGGNGRVMHMALANGFPPPSYRPLLDPFTARYRVVSLSPRPLWIDPPPPSSAPTWRTLGEDLLAGMRQYNLTEVIAVGHSFGAMASIFAAIADPKRFRALILLDPTILTPGASLGMKLLRVVGITGRWSLVQGALNRRHRFADEDEAFAYWRGKPLFKQWSDEVLWHYTRSLTKPAADGNGLELAWSREWEAHYYRTIFTDAWHEVPKLRGLLPTLVIRGTDTNAFLAPSMRRMQALVPDATYHEIEGHGHLFPHSAPDQTRVIMERWLEKAWV